MFYWAWCEDERDRRGEAEGITLPRVKQPATVLVCLKRGRLIQKLGACDAHRSLARRNPSTWEEPPYDTKGRNLLAAEVPLCEHRPHEKSRKRARQPQD